MQHRLCVLIPVFNNPAGLSLTLDSLRETSSEFDVLIVDDGSETPLDVPPLGGRRRVGICRCPVNRGISGALNLGLHAILEKEYKYVGRLDAGDIAKPERFEKQSEFLETHPDHGLVGSYIEFCDVSRNWLFSFEPPTRHEQIVARMHVENCLIHSGVTIRASAIEDVGCYLDSASAAEDYELFWRLMKKYRVAILPEVLTVCEMNPLGISVKRRRRQQIERLRCQVRHFDHLAMSSYWGLLRTLGALFVPQQFVFQAKR